MPIEYQDMSLPGIVFKLMHKFHCKSLLFVWSQGVTKIWFKLTIEPSIQIVVLTDWFTLVTSIINHGTTWQYQWWSTLVSIMYIYMLVVYLDTRQSKGVIKCGSNWWLDHQFCCSYWLTPVTSNKHQYQTVSMVEYTIHF